MRPAVLEFRRAAALAIAGTAGDCGGRERLKLEIEADGRRLQLGIWAA